MRRLAALALLALACTPVAREPDAGPPARVDAYVDACSESELRAAVRRVCRNCCGEGDRRQCIYWSCPDCESSVGDSLVDQCMRD